METDRQLQKASLVLMCTLGWGGSSFGCAWLFPVTTKQICLTSWWAEPHHCQIAGNNRVVLYCSRDLAHYFLDTFSWPLSYVLFLLSEQTTWPLLCPWSQPAEVQFSLKCVALGAHLSRTLSPLLTVAAQGQVQQAVWWVCEGTHTALRARKLLSWCRSKQGGEGNLPRAGDHTETWGWELGLQQLHWHY